MVESNFQELEEEMAARGPDAVLERLASRLRSEKRYHELFDALLMRSRLCLGLPAVLATPLDELPEPLRNRVEEAYLDACREAGTLLMADGKLREAWMYLRPVGDKSPMAAALEQAEADDENLQELIEIALHEGVSPPRGFQLVLEHYGTCNAITTLEGMIGGRPTADQRRCVAALVRSVHRELLANVRSDIARQEGDEPAGTMLSELVTERQWLFGQNNYHLDTTHLAATVRFARILDDQRSIQLALDISEYGKRLSSQFQFTGQEPFIEIYPSHGLFFAAQLGQQVEEALMHFRRRALEVNVDEHGASAVETYIALLARLGRLDDAIEAAALVPVQARLSGFAPSLIELSRMAGNYDRMLEACRQRQDVLGFAAALLERDRP